MRSAVVTGVVLFWVGSLVAGALAPGYAVRDDYVSSLAGRGSEVALVGVAALVLLALAHLAGAATVRGALAVPLGLAGVAGLTVAAFRTGCPLGAAACGVPPNDAPADLADTVHGLAVAAYEVAFVAAMALVALRGGPAWWRGVTVAAAVASVGLLLQTGGEANGLWQRAWLLVNTGWLVALALRAP